MTEIKLYRDRLYPQVARPGPAWRWTYEYQVDDGPRVGYGTHLASLRDRLKRKYPGATITETWK